MTMGTISYTYDHQWYVDVADAASGAPKMSPTKRE